MCIRDRIKTIVPGPDRYAAGTLTITVSPNRRFDPVLAETTLPVDVLAACQVPRIDPAKAKQLPPPALYDKCLDDHGYRLTARCPLPPSPRPPTSSVPRRSWVSLPPRNCATYFAPRFRGVAFPRPFCPPHPLGVNHLSPVGSKTERYGADLRPAENQIRPIGELDRRQRPIRISIRTPKLAREPCFGFIARDAQIAVRVEAHQHECVRRKQRADRR